MTASTPSTDLYDLIRDDPSLLANCDAKYGYHVTNIKKDDETRYAELIPQYGVYEPYDKALLRLKTVKLSTTTSRKKLPNRSPYPYRGEVKQKYKRVQLFLDNFKDYNAFYMKNPAQTKQNIYQVFLLMTKTEEQTKFVEENLGDLFEKIDLHRPNPFLYLDRNTSTWKTNTFDKNGTNKQRYAVNLAVPHTINLKSMKCRWQSVEHKKLGEEVVVNAVQEEAVGDGINQDRLENIWRDFPSSE